MISDADRREMAATMRAISVSGLRNLTLGEMLNSILTRGAPRPTTEMSILASLADLIDRPTCENVHDGREFECSECGMQWHLLDRADSMEEWAHVRRPKFCPSCGKEVVSHAERRD